eukprot:ctg_1665.g341
MHQQGGSDAVALRVAEQYVQALANLAKEGTTLVVPANVADARGVITQALAIWEGVGSQIRQRHARNAGDLTHSHEPKSVSPPAG